MNRTTDLSIKAVIVVALCTGATAFAEWKPVEGVLMTEWAAKVDPQHPLPEYPRPQMQRAEWVNLNGLWDYAITGKDDSKPDRFEGQILVPFPIESALSGVRKPLTPKDRLWYRRTFAAPTLAGGNRLLLHFGAVDWQADLTVNGKSVGGHKGGYDSFTCDITDALKAGADNELVVSVYDSTGAEGQPRGKQNLNAMKKPGGIMYTPTSGIWQTVWLEPVPARFIEQLKIVPDLDGSRVSVSATIAGGGAENMEIEAVAMDGGHEAAHASGAAGKPLVLSIANAHPWSPDDPFLYSLKVSLKTGAAAADSVDSYFGMRKISLGQDAQGITRPMLNNKFVFQSGPLDQGFWPDGLYTAPTDDALRYDIEITKKLGFNMCRKHVKVEPDRWYYWCDKLGLLVWQDMPGSDAGKGGNKTRDGAAVSEEIGKQFEAELAAMVDQHANHPSIILWVVFNEGWGQYDTERLTTWVKQRDPTRLVNDASGWTDRGAGDVIDMHDYPGPGSPKPEEHRAAVLGEFGGLGFPVEGHKWVKEAWGYRKMTSPEELMKKYLQLWKKVWGLRESPGLSAAVYTQLTDVETESNGLLTYDRKVVKIDVDQAAAAVSRGEFPPGI